MKLIQTCTLVASLCFVALARAEVKPSALFGDHAVLQSGMAVPVWGTATPGEKVSVTIEAQTKTATAGADGKWIVRLTKLKAGGPFEMMIAGKNAGEKRIVVKDILVGEVWLGSGQSNMQFYVSNKGPGHAPYGLLDEEKEIAAANYPQVRMFTVKMATTIEPQTDAVGEWQVCTPQTVSNFSAVGYLFARDLNQALKLPVGIILSAFGASTAEAWIPRDALLADPLLKPMVDKLDARESYFKSHPGITDADAPPSPATINSRPGRPGPLRDPAHDQHQPTVLYNAMINPILPYAIRGAIWYQGESVTGGPAGLMLYGHVMDTLVTQWRKLWGEGNFPFYAVQLPGQQNVSNNPLIREEQAKILSLPNTGLAVVMDTSEAKNVHPKNKEPLGDRLTKIALANAYGKEGRILRPRVCVDEDRRQRHPREVHPRRGNGCEGWPTHLVPDRRRRPEVCGRRCEDRWRLNSSQQPERSNARSSSLCLGQLSQHCQPIQRRRSPSRALPHRQVGRDAADRRTVHRRLGATK